MATGPPPPGSTGAGGPRYAPSLPGMPVKYVLTYEMDPAQMAAARAHFPAHRARLDAFHAQGTLLLVGPFENPMDGAMGVFTSREAAESFVADDPFVLHHVVARWTLRGWNEIYGG